MAYAIDLEGKVVLVCGISHDGIGGATCRKLADAGATIFLVDKAQDILDLTMAQLEKAGVPHHGMVANLLYPEQSDPVVEAVWARYGRLDGVANVCGGTRENEWLPLEETSLESYRETLNLNLEYVFRICRDAAKSWIKRDWTGAIVNIGSMSAIAAAPYHGPYGAAKSGIGALTRTMAFEWSRYGIRANTVNPGACSTGRATRLSNTTSTDGRPESSSDFLWTTPEELADAVVFLLSDRASGVSGQTLTVDSGVTTKFATGLRRMDGVKRKLHT